MLRSAKCLDVIGKNSLITHRINAATRAHGMSYSVFMGKLQASEVLLNRKVLADLAINHPAAFEAVMKAVA